MTITADFAGVRDQTPPGLLQFSYTATLELLVTSNIVSCCQGYSYDIPPSAVASPTLSTTRNSNNNRTRRETITMNALETTKRKVVLPRTAVVVVLVLVNVLLASQFAPQTTLFPSSVATKLVAQNCSCAERTNTSDDHEGTINKRIAFVTFSYVPDDGNIERFTRYIFPSLDTWLNDPDDKYHIVMSKFSKRRYER